MTTPSPKRRPRRLLQFSLRSLLVFVLLVSIGLSWLGVKLERARRQREAVRAVEKAGGLVWYDYEFDAKGDYVPQAQPSWLLELCGRDFFFDVLEVSALRGGLGYNEASHYFGDDEASHLKVLAKLTRLDLHSTEITDAGLEHLEGLSDLETLWLNNTQITDAGLEHLERLTSLEDLTLCNTQVTDAGLEHLEGLTSLEGLTLSRTPVTDAGLKHLEGLTNLADLALYDTQVTPEGVKKLQEALPECEIQCRHYWED